MGVLTLLGVAAVTFLAWRPLVDSLSRVSGILAAAWNVLLALDRVLRFLSLPPGSAPYTGGPTWWDALWHLSTLGPLRQLFGPGRFMRQYALLVVPALAVAAIAGLALAARGSWLRGFARWLVERWTQALGAGALLLSVALAQDAVWRYGLRSRLFLAVLRGSAALLLAFSGLVALSGSEEDGGFSRGQVLAWLWALGLSALAATAGVGGGSLLHAGLTASTRAGASVLPGGESAADRPTLLLYGCVMLLVSGVAASCLGEDRTLWWLARAVLRGLSSCLGLARLAKLLGAARRAVRWAAGQPAVRTAVAVATRADEALTDRLAAAFHRTCRIVRSALRALQVRQLAAAARRVASAVFGNFLRPAGRALRALAARALRLALWPLLLELGALARLHVAPVMWPLGTLAATLWFGRQAVVHRSPLPFGAAAYTGAVITCLMAGKAMRRSHRHAALARYGAALESVAATAYLQIDFGANRLAAGLLSRALTAAAAAALLVTRALVALGHGAWALLAAPLAGLAAAVATAGWWIWVRLVRAVSPWLAAACRLLAQVVAAVWARPEWSLVLSAAVVAAAYGAHEAGLAGAVWRGGVSVAATLASVSARHLSWLLLPLSPLLRTLAALLDTSRSASAAVAGGAAGALSLWSRRAATDMTSLFASPGFSGAFLALNLAHVVLLKGWAVPALRSQGAVGLEAVTPVISFVARSTGKVALGPMYLTAAASFLGAAGGAGLAGCLASLTGPALWILYLGVFWLEAVRRVVSGQSEFASHVRAVCSSITAARAAAGSATSATSSGAGAPASPQPAEGPAGQPLVAPPASNGTPSSPPPRPVNTPAAAAAAAAAASVPAASEAHLVRARPIALPVRASDPAGQRLLDQLRRQEAAAPEQQHYFPTDTCAVCIEDLQVPLAGEAAAGVQPVQVLRCGHVFHLDCILDWLKRSGRCPVCREPAVGPSRHTNMLF